MSIICVLEAIGYSIENIVLQSNWQLYIGIKNDITILYSSGRSIILDVIESISIPIFRIFQDRVIASIANLYIIAGIAILEGIALIQRFAMIERIVRIKPIVITFIR